MVSNKNIVLDAGQNKYVPECIMPKNIDAEIIKNFINSDKKKLHKKIIDPITFESENILIDNPNYIEPTDRYVNFKKKFCDPVYDTVLKNEYQCHGVHDYITIRQEFGWKKILDYMGIIPFSPSVMINISPHWKSEKCPKSWMEIKKNALKYALEKYLNDCNRYDNWEAVIECGSEGNFVHAHAVAHVNPQMLRSVLGDGRPKGAKNTSHIGKGSGVKGCLQKHINKYFTEYFKDKRALEKAFNAHLKCDEGYRGLLGGKFSVQICILRNEVLVKDKQDYLIEEKKPEGHKNMDVEGFPLYFTSKVITENVERNPFEG